MRGLLAAILIAVAPAAQAQAPDPVAAAVGQEWQAAEIGRQHLAEALQKLIQAYGTLQEKRQAVDAYWKDYVAGLTKDAQTGAR
jgi:hypothetical protein